jgi:hypothetical protein
MRIGRRYHWSQSGDVFSGAGVGDQLVAFSEVDGLVAALRIRAPSN